MTRLKSTSFLDQTPLEQQTLADATGYTLEHPVTTGIPSWRCARLDLAQVELLIAVEVDGKTHTSALQRSRDSRKEVILSNLGWTVLRFTNEEINSDLQAVLQTIWECEYRIRSSSQSNPS
jgi:hypothetical protein